MAILDRGNGQVIHYEDNGSGDSAIVLVHGWGMSLRMWDYNLMPLLRAGHRVVSIDQRGCGRSDKDFDDMGINAIAGDVVALVEKLGLSRVVLNGWSLGGAVVVAAAAALGARCAGLVLTCGATPAYLQKDGFAHGGTEEDLAGTLAALGDDRANFLLALSQGVCAGEVSDAVVNWMWRQFMEGSPRAALSLAELGPLDQRDILGSLTVPILSVVGAQDAVVDPGICRSVVDYNSNARILEFERAGHAPFIEEREAYNRELAAFVKDCL
jgi:pimeloyl-ACP methyl ester carboxylesterase